jgi:hypothetical protein
MSSDVEKLIESVLGDYSASQNQTTPAQLTPAQQDRLTKGVEKVAAKKAKEVLLPAWYAAASLALFVVANFSVMVLVWVAYQDDVWFLKNNIKTERLISPGVMMSLIAGITVQTGSAFLIITNFFFGKKEEISEKVAN